MTVPAQARHILPQGTTYYRSVSDPLACALLLHDRATNLAANVSLVAKACNDAGIDVLVCSLCDMPQPLTKKILLQAWNWLTETFHYPQIGIGIGVGSHMQYMFPWSSTSALILIDMPAITAYQSVTQPDLFTASHVSVPGIFPICITPQTAKQLIAAMQKKHTFSQLWLINSQNHVDIPFTTNVSQLQITDAFGDNHTDTLLYARLIATWAITKLPQKKVPVTKVPTGGVEIQLADSNNIEVRIRNLATSFPLDVQTPQLLLCSALASYSMLELRAISAQARWAIPRCSIMVRPAEIDKSEIDISPNKTVSVGMEHTSNTNIDQVRYIREIRIFDNMDEIRKNLLHESLCDSTTFYGLSINFINRIR